MYILEYSYTVRNENILTTTCASSTNASGICKQNSLVLFLFWGLVSDKMSIFFRSYLTEFLDFQELKRYSYLIAMRYELRHRFSLFYDNHIKEIFPQLISPHEALLVQLYPALHPLSFVIRGARIYQLVCVKSS